MACLAGGLLSFPQSTSLAGGPIVKFLEVIWAGDEPGSPRGQAILILQLACGFHPLTGAPQSCHKTADTSPTPAWYPQSQKNNTRYLW